MKHAENPPAAGRRRILDVPAELAGSRLDQALALLLPEHSRAFVKKLFERGTIELSGAAAKPALRVKGGETIRVFIPDAEPLEAVAEDLPLDVLYEDADIIVVDKRPGMAAHPSQGHRDGTLVNALLHHYGESLSGIGGVLRPGIVHRLDMNTSGCLAAAKSDAAHRDLVRQFMDREVEKIYLALTDGVPRPAAGKVEGNMGRGQRDRRLHAMLKSGGRYSLTHYRTLENYGAVALVECRLLTGRTHQARVHLARTGAPVLCDRDYGGREEFGENDLAAALELFRRGTAARAAGTGRPLLSRQGLHAWRLCFRHPADGRRLEFEAPLPADMLSVLEPLRAARREMG